jgi:excisionase family DNA binding protein
MKKTSTISKKRVPAPIQYINTKEAAVIFNCSPDTVVWWIKNDVLPAVKRGRNWYIPLRGALRIKQNDMDLARPPPD